MTKQEFFEKSEELRKDYESKLHQLQAECAKENDPYEIGDIVEDHRGYVKIEGRVICRHRELPFMIYNGIELRKADKQPKKIPVKRDVYQHNIIALISRP